MRITRAKLDEKLRSSLPSKFSRFIYTIHAIEHLSEEVYEEMYGTKKGFQFSLDDRNAKIPINKGSGYIQGAEFNQHFDTLRKFVPTTVNYKMYVDDGAPTNDIRARSIRANFISRLIQKIKSYSNLIRYGLKNGNIRFNSAADGSNPRLEIQIKYDRAVLNRRTGKKEKRDISINLVLALKYLAEKSGKDEAPFKKFKPNLVPRLIGNRLSSKNFKSLVEKYIHSQNISLASKKVFLDAVEHAYSSNNLKVPSVGSSDFSSELFEVLTPLKLARNIETKNTTFLKNYLGWDDSQINAINPSYIRIFLPTSANEALIDYEVFYNKQNSIKVSVKSRIGGTVPATVKFHTVFDNESEVDKWFDGLIPKMKSSRSALGQKIVAKTAMEYSAKGGGRTTLYPIKALYDLLNDGKFSQATWNDLKSTLEIPNGLNLQTFKSILKKIESKIHSSVVTERHIPMDGIFNLSAQELKHVKLLIAYNIPYRNPAQRNKYIDFAERNVISQKIEFFTKKGAVQKVVYEVSEDHDLAEKRYPFALNNFAYLCEKVVVTASKNNGSSRINFWKLFYDNVLSKKKILYSIMYENISSGGMELEYKFISAVNMSKYKKWVELRSKNNAFNMQDTLGMNV